MDTTIELFVNGDQFDSQKVDKKGTFHFEDVKLTSGNNTIKARAIDNNKNGPFSDEVTIRYINKQPSLTIEAPSDGQSFGKDSSPIQVHGKTDPGNKVTVNDFWAIVDDSGNYTYMLTIKGGDNDILVTATDPAGNTTQKKIKVTYNQ